MSSLRGKTTLIVGFLVGSCATGPLLTNNPTPPTASWVFYDQVSGLRQTLASRQSITSITAPGDNYEVVFVADEPGGIKSISLSAQGAVTCYTNQAPYPLGHPFNFTIPKQTLTFAPLPNSQAYTHAAFPYLFNWTTGPTATASSGCPSHLLAGGTVYQGQAVNYGGVSSGTYSLYVKVPALF